MTRSQRIERAARIAMHWFDPEGEGQHPDDPDLDGRGMYWLLRVALEWPDDDPELKRLRDFIRDVRPLLDDAGAVAATLAVRADELLVLRDRTWR